MTWDVWRAGRGDAAGIERRQQRRLRDLVDCARACSPYYRAALRGLPSCGPVRLADLPPVTKTEMMPRFDDWVTDPAVTQAGVQELLRDPDRVGETFLGRYLVTTTSGSTGSPGVVLFDARARQVAMAIGAVRGLDALSGIPWRRVLWLGGRQVAIYATGGHYLAETFVQHRYRRRPVRHRFSRMLSVTTPLDELVAELNAFRPAFLGSYPSVLDLLAREQEAGRLAIAPPVVTSGGEHLSSLVTARLVRQWDCQVWDSYNATEAMPLTVPCVRGRFHVNADWMILEPVDADRRPVPPGTPSTTTLVTNLANHLQPIIRYELGDSVTFSVDGCPCGSPLPVVTVVGRTNDLLRFAGPEGKAVDIPPLALGSVIEETDGVRRYQAVQTSPSRLTLRLEAERGSDPDRVWADTARGLRAFLARQGVCTVELERDPNGPRSDPHSGKLRQVLRAFEGGADRPTAAPKT